MTKLGQADAVGKAAPEGPKDAGAKAAAEEPAAESDSTSSDGESSSSTEPKEAVPKAAPADRAKVAERDLADRQVPTKMTEVAERKEEARSTRNVKRAASPRRSPVSRGREQVRTRSGRSKMVREASSGRATLDAKEAGWARAREVRRNSESEDEYPRQSFRPDDVVHGLFGHLYLKRLWAQMSVKNREKLEIQQLSLSCLALPEQMRK